MTALAIYAFVMTLGFLGITYPRTRKLFLTAPKDDKPKLLPAGEGAKLSEWKTVFRDTVVAVDGGLTPEMEAFLASDEAAKVREQALATRLLDEAREQAKKELDALLSGKRRLLQGEAHRAFAEDFNVSTTMQERLDVARRWHDKGYKFDDEVRQALLRNSSPGPKWRDEYRKMFDEQDSDK